MKRLVLICRQSDRVGGAGIRDQGTRSGMQNQAYLNRHHEGRQGAACCYPLVPLWLKWFGRQRRCSSFDACIQIAPAVHRSARLFCDLRPAPPRLCTGSCRSNYVHRVEVKPLPRAFLKPSSFRVSLPCTPTWPTCRLLLTRRRAD